MEEFDGPYAIVGDRLKYHRYSSKDASAPAIDDVCGTDELISIAYDKEENVLLRRGIASKVQSWAAQTRLILVTANEPAFAAAITVVTFPITPDTVAELNACVEITGRVSKLIANLGKIGEVDEEMTAAGLIH